MLNNSGYIPPGGKVTEGISKLEGYNQGIQEATKDFELIIIGLFIGHLIRLITWRLLMREKPFQFTVNEYSIGPDKQLEEYIEPFYIKKLDGSILTFELFLISYLLISTFIPAYTWEVKL